MRRPANILALDAAMEGCGACAFRAADGAVFPVARPMARGQAEHLMPMAQETMARAGLRYADLGAIIATVGPGAFTGLRVGVSAAGALALALGIPAFGITTLRILALQTVAAHRDFQRLTIVIETKREDFYCQAFGPGAAALSAPRALTAAEIESELMPEPCAVAGDGAARLQSLLPPGVAARHRFMDGSLLPDPALMARLFAEQGPEPEFFSSGLAPVYLRAPDVTLPAARGAAGLRGRLSSA